MTNAEEGLSVVCDLGAELPLSPDELQLIQDLLPDLLRDMAWQQIEEE